MCKLRATGKADLCSVFYFQVKTTISDKLRTLICICLTITKHSIAGVKLSGSSPGAHELASRTGSGAGAAVVLAGSCDFWCGVGALGTRGRVYTAW